MLAANKLHVLSSHNFLHFNGFSILQSFLSVGLAYFDSCQHGKKKERERAGNGSVNFCKV